MDNVQLYVACAPAVTVPGEGLVLLLLRFLFMLVSEHLEFTRLLLSCDTSSVNTSVPMPRAAITQMMCALWVMSCSAPAPFFILAIILVELDFGLICPKNVFPGLCRLFKTFSSKVQSSLWIREVAWISIQRCSLGWLL